MKLFNRARTLQDITTEIESVKTEAERLSARKDAIEASFVEDFTRTAGEDASEYGLIMVKINAAPRVLEQLESERRALALSLALDELERAQPAVHALFDEYNQFARDAAYYEALAALMKRGKSAMEQHISAKVRALTETALETAKTNGLPHADYLKLWETLRVSSNVKAYGRMAIDAELKPDAAAFIESEYGIKVNV